MIVAEQKPVGELVDKLKNHKKVLLLGCATCVAECAAGGEREVETLAPLLRMALNKAGHDIEIHTKTIERQCEWEFLDEIEGDVAGVEAILSIACGIGVQAMAERFAAVRVYPGVNTNMLGIRQEEGLWLSRCAACGECVLGETFGLCPVARCSKSLMNGPCGGTRETGKCEINEETDCVWTQIVERAKARKLLDALKEIRTTKDWSNSRHGGPKRILREDLRQ